MLGLLWNLAHSEDVPTDIMDLALSAHIKILDYSCSQVIQLQKYVEYVAVSDFVIVQFQSHGFKLSHVQAHLMMSN